MITMCHCLQNPARCGDEQYELWNMNMTFEKWNPRCDAYRDRLDYSKQSDAYNADLGAPCILIYHNYSPSLRRGTLKGVPNCTKNSFVVPGHRVAKVKGWNLYIFWDWWWILGIQIWWAGEGMGQLTYYVTGCTILCFSPPIRTTSKSCLAGATGGLG